MATVSKWTPYGIALNVTANAGTITRTSATQYTVVLNVSWKTYYSGASTNYGMKAASGGETKYISTFGTYRSSGSASFTGKYSISGTGKQTKSITVTFTNYNSDNGKSSSKNVTLSVSVPEWPTYSVSYNANGGSGAPSKQTKVKNATLKLSTTKPTRTGYSFKNWNTNSGSTGTTYSPGGSYTANAAATLYAQWKANTYTVSYNANGGSGEPSSQTKTYGVDLTLSTTKPTRTNYTFKGWGTSASATTVAYAAGATYSANSSITLYAVWELAYWKPKITKVSVARCTSDGTVDNQGTYALVKFNWELCQLLGANNVSSITIACNNITTTVSASGISGSVSQVIGADALSIDDSYNVVVTVADSMNGSTSLTNSLPTSSFAIDVLAGGKGIAFGKVAEETKTIETPWKFYSENTDIGFMHTHGTTGNIAGVGVGSGGENRGVWMKNASAANGSWLLYSNGTDDTVLNGVNPDGEIRGLLRLNSSNNLHFGYGSYDNSEGNVFYNGNMVDVRTNTSFKVKHSDGYTYLEAPSSANSKNTTLGYGSYKNDFDTYIYGHNIRMTETLGYVNFNGKKAFFAQQGAVTITPKANTPTSKTVTFPYAFTSTVRVVVTPYSSVPGTIVLGCSCGNITTTGFTATVTRTNTTDTVLCWIAVGYM